MYNNIMSASEQMLTSASSTSVHLQYITQHYSGLRYSIGITGANIHELLLYNKYFIRDPKSTCVNASKLIFSSRSASY